LIGCSLWISSTSSISSISSISRSYFCSL
jgi:hypothetical protein